MFTKIKVDKTGETIAYRTQQYEIGLYVIENDDPSRQYCIDSVSEVEFHKTIRGFNDVTVVEKR